MQNAFILCVCLLAAISESNSRVARAAAASASSDSRPVADNPLDELVIASSPGGDLWTAELSSDAEFLRRASLTTIGQLPAPAEVRAFVRDIRADKRERKIDELLQHELHAALWAAKFCELTGNSSATLAAADDEKLELAQIWHEWLRERFAENERYDQLVRAIITATSRGESSVADWIDDQVAVTWAVRQGRETAYAKRDSLDLFWRRSDIAGQYPTREVAERIASSFMGVRINCARCHDHPFDHWSQQDYRGFTRIFAGVRYGMSPELRREVANRLQHRRQAAAVGASAPPALPRLTEVYVTEAGSVFADATPTPLDGPPLDENAADLRVEFAAWLTQADNKYFARNFTNRVWDHYFGRGLVEPLDGHSASDQTPHAPLLDELTAQFAASGYDIQKLERMILNSRVWQLSSRSSRSGESCGERDLRPRVRLPSPAVVVDMWHGATGIDRDFGSERLRGLRAVELGTDRLADSRWDGFLRLFGRTHRTETCDCSPEGHPTVRQTLVMMSDPQLLADISHGELPRLVASELTDAELVDELFLRTLSRWPTANERQSALQACSVGNRREAMEDILWGLLNTQEFITIH